MNLNQNPPGQAPTAAEAGAAVWLGVASCAAANTQPADAAQQVEALLAAGREAIVAAGYRQAYAIFMQASQLAHEQGLAQAEARALAQLAYAAACLGHNEEAIETAMLASQLAEHGAAPLVQLTSLNYLGVALLWNGSHGGADAILAQASTLALEAAPDQAQPLFWQPQINRCFNEAYRQIALRHLEQRAVQPAPLQALLAGLERQAAGRQPGSLLLQGLWLWLDAVRLAWQGDAAAAGAACRAYAAHAQRMPQAGLLQAMRHWLEAELALCGGDWQGALLAARQMSALCERIELQPLLRLALRLCCDAHEQLGEGAAALRALRQLQQQEHRLRQVSMQHRHQVAALRLELRRQRQAVADLKHDTEALQRLSMEDPLTGLANRRGLEQSLERALAALRLQGPEGLSLFIAVVDVDEFKRVNDRHSHAVGDQVLRELAELFRQHLRSQDIAGRWGGDEFVLAFWADGEASATQVAERLLGAVRQRDWSRLAAGLRLSISLGLSQARPGDGLESLLQRGDQGMYLSKRERSGRASDRDSPVLSTPAD